MPDLFTPLRLGALTLPNRIVMAPLTRMRAAPGGIPTGLTVEYYRQRASAGLIISEGTAISPQAQGYPNTPGICSSEQIAAWRAVTRAVHNDGGRMVMQIAHNGRNSHSSFQADGSMPVSASAIPPSGVVLTSSFQQVPAQVPAALRTEEVGPIVEAYRIAAVHAIEAGFDGVELQAANSHLIEQFLESGSNQRTDQYGGSLENRARFLFEVVAAVSDAIGKDRLGVRLSPFGQYGGISDTSPMKLFLYVIEGLSARNIAYLHVIEARGSEMGLTDELHADALNNAQMFRRFFAGGFLSAAAYTPLTAAVAVESGMVDAVAFGRMFLANPDLPERVRRKAALNQHDRSTFYGGGAAGYTDYPFLA